MSLVSTTDFFFPSVDDPYTQGRIAFCNVASDLYAMGLTEIQTVLMILGVSTDMSSLEQEIVTSQLIQGFSDEAKRAGTSVTGGQTVFNPWPIIGGVAMSVAKNNEILMPNGAKSGQVLVLTKPLGTQIAVNAYQWYKSKPALYDKIKHLSTPDKIEKAFLRASEEMATLNLEAARLMKNLGASCATDVTGFGILGHAEFLAKVQKENVDFVIEKLPIIKDLVQFEKINRDFKILEGKSAETSGGLLIAFEKENAEEFIKKREEQGEKAWIIGKIIEGEKKAKIDKNIKIIEV